MWRALFIICIWFPGFVQAQILSEDAPVTPSRNYSSYGQRQLFFLANINVALPFGDYGSQDYYNADAGFARSGFHAQLNVGRVFQKIIGVTGSVGVIRHPANLDRIEFILTSINQTRINDLQYKGYYHYYADAGLLLSFEVSRSTQFDVRLMAGVSYGIDSDLSFKYSTPGGINKGEVGKADDIALLLNPGATFRMQVREKLVISANVDYMFASYSYSNVPQRLNGTLVGAVDYDVVMHNLSFGLGLGITLR